MMMTTFQVLYITGITNLIFFLLIVFSCRCMGFWKITKPLLKYRWFQKVYSKHCWYWYGFFISVIIHAVTAFTLFPFPF